MLGGALWFIVLGALFFFLMRMGGCGSHQHGGHAHGGGSGHGGKQHPSAERPGEAAKDPVCGMEVRVAEAAGSTRHESRQYYFCSARCQGQFLQDPGRYAR